MEITKPWGRVPKGEPGFKFYRDSEGKVAPPLPMKSEPSPDCAGDLKQIPLDPWMLGGDYTIMELAGDMEGEFAVCALRNGEPHLWTTNRLHAKGDAARHLMGPEFKWELACTPEGWVQQAINTLRTAGGMFPELRWSVEYSALALDIDTEHVEAEQGPPELN